MNNKKTHCSIKYYTNVNHDNFIVVLFCGVKVSFGGTRPQKYTANRYFNVNIIFTKLWHIGTSVYSYYNIVIVPIYFFILVQKRYL